MTAVCSLAVAQTTPTRGDVAANVEQHLRLADVAAKSKARVVVFPELSLTGYELDLANDLSFSENDPRLDALVAVARSQSLTLVVGAPARIDSRLHVGAFLLSPDGAIELYTKQHLGAFSASANPGGRVPPAENTVFHPGQRTPLVSVGGSTAAVAVCADTGHPSHARAAAQRGATIYLASMFVIPAHLDEETANLKIYASRHSMAVAFANYGGPTAGLPSGGRSAIWSETGERLVELDGSGAGVAVAARDRAGWRVRKVMLG